MLGDPPTTLESKIGIPAASRIASYIWQFISATKHVSGWIPNPWCPKVPAIGNDSYDHGRHVQLCSKDSPQLSQSIKTSLKLPGFFYTRITLPVIFLGPSNQPIWCKLHPGPLAPTTCHAQIWHDVRGRLPQPTCGTWHSVSVVDLSSYYLIECN